MPSCPQGRACPSHGLSKCRLPQPCSPPPLGAWGERQSLPPSLTPSGDFKAHVGPILNLWSTASLVILGPGDEHWEGSPETCQVPARSPRTSRVTLGKSLYTSGTGFCIPKAISSPAMSLVLLYFAPALPESAPSSPRPQPFVRGWGKREREKGRAR